MTLRVVRSARLVARYSVSSSQSSQNSVALNDELPALPPDAYPLPNNPLRMARDLKQYAAEEKPRYRLHVHSTRNNTIATFTKPNGAPIAWFSGGSCGFKKGNRASYEAGYQCAVRMFKRMAEEAKSVRSMQVDLLFKGFGQGREALQRALLTSEGEPVRSLVATVTDRTPIKIGGTRAKKKRRL